MELTQEEKAARLQWAVLNCSVAALVNICDELGFVEMSAPALGLACRFRGLEVVRALAERLIFHLRRKSRKNTAVMSGTNTQITARIMHCICSKFSAAVSRAPVA